MELARNTVMYRREEKEEGEGGRGEERRGEKRKGKERRGKERKEEVERRMAAVIRTYCA